MCALIRDLMFNNNREKESSRYTVLRHRWEKKTTVFTKEHLFKVLGLNSLSRLFIYWEFEHDNFAKGNIKYGIWTILLILNTGGNRKCFSAQALTGIAFTALNSHRIVNLVLLYEAKFWKPFILSGVNVIEWDMANTLVFWKTSS